LYFKVWARRISENVFGILVQNCRIFMRPLRGNPDNIITHNLIRNDEGFKVLELTYDSMRKDGERSRLQNFPNRRGGENREAFNLREKFKQYFISPEGSVEWQRSRALMI